MPSSLRAGRRARPRHAAALLFALGPLLAVAPLAAETATAYQTPPQALVDLVDAPPTPEAELSPDKAWLVLLERPSLPPVAELAAPELRLAGLRINPRTNGPSRTRPYSGMRLVRLDDGGERPVSGLPPAARIDDLAFSPDGSRLAFTVTGDEGIELWVLDLATAAARRLTGPVLDLAAGAAPAWLGDGSGLVAPLVPADRRPEPPAPRVPTGPVVQETLGQAAPARTYQDLLADPHDEALFEHYLTVQLARVGLDGQVTPLGAPGVLRSFEPSPDGRFLLVEQYHRPFSYLVPAWRFPARVEIWNRDGERLRTLADLPLQEGVPIARGSVPTGPRGISWRADAPATLVWAEALDGGDAGAPAALRDRVLALPAPFDGAPSLLANTMLRFGGIDWGDGGTALLREWWWKTRRTRLTRLRPDDPDADPQLVFDYSFQDRYHDPGLPVSEPDAAGRPALVLADDGASFFLIGDGASPEGDRPFLDRFDPATAQSRRLFHSAAPYYERPVALLDRQGHRILTRRESVDEPPDYFVRDLEAGTVRRLTSFPDPAPQLAGLSKELIRYRRADGVDLTATLYLPPGYDADRDGPLPMLMWAYPMEFKSADAAGQVTDSPYRFARVTWSSPIVWLTQGYAVLDHPSMPIVGEGDAEPNDTYVEQLVASARAAVDEVVRRGVADPRRIAIGGHSYGAFMTANLLAHSDLFAAGIARSGAYNRSLTPFGFQAEDRTFWQAPQVYFAMSPFMHADEVDEPLLMIHGMADNNSGTFPLQSERFYDALKGLGATARLVMLPYESHGYRARESVLHMLWEMNRWLDTYVKNRPAAADGTTEAAGRSD